MLIFIRKRSLDLTFMYAIVVNKRNVVLFA